MSGLASEGQESASERIFREAPLSFVLLEGLIEVDGGELENAGLGPVVENVELVAEVTPGLEAVKLAASQLAMRETNVVLAVAPSSEPTKRQFFRPTASL